MSAPLTYVYCLVRSSRRPSIRDTTSAIPGAKAVRALDAGDGVWAIVSTVPARTYSEAAIADGLQDLDWVGRLAMAHESVVERFLGAPAVLPMQLFTLFTADDRVLDHVARERRRIDRIFARIARHLEWGLRLSFDEAAARAAVDERSARQASGTAYLSRKRDLLSITRGQAAAARAQADRLFRGMARLATDARRRTATERASPGSRLLLDAAFLVPAQRTAAFRAALRQHLRKLDASASGIVASLSGPWPPYNFIHAPSRAASRRDSADARQAPAAAGNGA
jgi:hypothetical protein